MLCNRLKFCRLNKNLTIKQLSDLSGVSETTISKIENMNCSVRFTSAKKLCVALGVDIDYLFYFV